MAKLIVMFFSPKFSFYMTYKQCFHMLISLCLFHNTVGLTLAVVITLSTPWVHRYVTSCWLAIGCSCWEDLKFDTCTAPHSPACVSDLSFSCEWQSPEVSAIVVMLAERQSLL